METKEEMEQRLDAMIAAANARYPRLRAALVATGRKGLELDLKMSELAAFGWEEDVLLDMLSLGPPKPTALVTTSRTALTRRLEVTKHAIVRWWRQRGWFERVFYLIGWSLALVGPSMANGFTLWSVIGIALVVLIRMNVARKEFSPKHMLLLRKNHDQRQLALEKLTHTMVCWRKPPSEGELLEFRTQALSLIASYVRDHRADLRKRRIFANLLVRVGNAVMVIARSDLNRKLPEVYRSTECSFVWACIESGEPQLTGDVYGDAPATQPGKRYHSILTMPVKKNGHVVAVVSIDSEAKYHFDSHFEELQTELAPYVQLLAVGRQQDHDVDAGEPPALAEGKENGNPGDP